MTTITFRDGILACDGRANMGHMLVGEHFPKIVKIARGHYFASSGDTARANAFIRRRTNMLVLPVGEERSYLYDFTHLDNETSVIEVKDGELFYFCNTGEVPLSINEYHAFGSGAPYALTAMDCGKSAKEAIRFAALRDPFTNTNITWRRVL